MCSSAYVVCVFSGRVDLRTLLADAPPLLRKPVEVSAFSDEEGVRFQSTFLGSFALASKSILLYLNLFHSIVSRFFSWFEFYIFTSIFIFNTLQIKW